ncbi:unnamed protein product [Thlaspi arvense]|uniref:Uncharacterized protein n=1 Tax=Thlaspi arvense TaxID=13288 RepID=A0AAU9RZ24_THLAR|nr:unnamed protein product [Thlaspi arvense]
MGNCLRHESEMHWAGEDWDEFINEDEEEDHHHHSSTTSTKAKTVVVRGDSKASDPSHEIKIRLTKKQLQDLLSKVNVHDLTFQQEALSCPSLANTYEESNQQRSWRPVLQSIPENKQNDPVAEKYRPKHRNVEESKECHQL